MRIIEDDYCFEKGSVEDKLYQAAVSGKENAVLKYLKKGANPNLRNNYYGSKTTPLMAASEKGHSQIVELLLAHGANVDERSEEPDPPQTQRKTALHFAASSGNAKVVEELLNAGADVNAMDSKGSTPVCYAAYKAFVPVVKLLKERGADLNVVPKLGYSPLALAIATKDQSLLDLLIGFGVKPNSRDPNPLEQAVLRKDLDLVQQMLDMGANPNAVDARGFSSLMMAAKFGQVEIVKVLLTAEANPDFVNRDGFTALDYARINKHDEVELLIRKKGGIVNRPTQKLSVALCALCASVLKSWTRIALSLVVFLAASASSGEPDKPGPKPIPQIPPPGVPVPNADKAELEAGIKELGGEIDSLRTALKGKAALLDLIPDVQIYYNAVRYALTYNEFFKAPEIGVGKTLLKQGLERAKALKEGTAPWTTATGLVARGYVSKIDGSVQPYGLVVPASYNSGGAHRLDTWFHGRGEQLSELNFINERQKSPGEFTPPHTLVLHLYGRYCCANKLAGEVDLFEALDHVKKHYTIDENRIVIRGFSMGGAAAWHFAVHFADRWCAAAPGAGFSETPDFLRVFAKENLTPIWYEQKLFHMYDCTDYAINLFNLPTVAYSGEIDSQKQAADIMARALAEEGLEMTHIIGPKTPHKYEANAKIEINRRIDSIAERGRNPMPAKVRFTTWTLSYNQMYWVTVDGLEKHWERARVDAEIAENNLVKVATQNVSALTLNMAAGLCPLDIFHKPKVKLDGKEFDAPAVQTDRSWTVHFRKNGKKWELADSAEDDTLHKRHGLQGPIDDAFMDSFVMVKPTGKAMNEKVGAWVGTEMAHAIDHWRKQFRGEARVTDDSAVTDAEIAASNLVLWGDPSSNKILAKIADKLPIKWDDKGVVVGGQLFSADHHVPVLIYPNPLNPKKYVVLNSGFTFREYDYLNNARQIPKLPDFAVINVDVPPNPRTPGEIVTAGFFGEQWELLKPEK